MIAATIALAAALLSSEADYRDHICGAAGWQMEVRLPNGTRADCVSETHAIEIDFSNHWAEALGQSLNYAAETDKRPGIILVCKRGTEPRCLSWALRLEQTIARWRLPVTVWLCDAEGECSTDGDSVSGRRQGYSR